MRNTMQQRELPSLDWSPYPLESFIEGKQVTDKKNVENKRRLENSVVAQNTKPKENAN
ncbi:hypothetical protein [Pseudochryseolinea flava]|nr:hypothetical protein [Pseudochryseolinea flava]